MPYIICNNNYYLHQDKKCRLSIVHTMEEATRWSDISKANNVVTHNAKRQVQLYGLEVRYITNENVMVNSVAGPVELGYDILDKIKEISTFTKEIEDRRLYLMDQLHTIDLEIVDIEHAAEFYILNAAQGYKIYKMLHDARVKRREYKDELQKINSTLGTSIKSNNMKNLEKSITGLENRKYTPRVNKELFGV